MDKEEQIISEIQAIRRKNLIGLINGEKTSEFAERFDLNPAYISQLKTRKRTFGEKAARKIEAHLGLPWFSLDQDPDETLTNASEQELISAVSSSLEWLSEDGKKRLIREISQTL